MPITVRLIENKNWPNKTVYPGCTRDIAPYLSTKNGGIRYTGFDETNTEDRDRLSKALNTDLSTNSLFWDFYSVRLGEEDLILYPENNPQDELKAIFLARHEQGCYAEKGVDATKIFVIVDEEKSAIEANKKAILKRKLYRALDEMSDEDVRDCLRMFGINPTGASQNVCNQKINDIVETQAARFNELWFNNAQRPTYILFYRALNAEIITNRKGVYAYNAETLGTTPEQVIAYLSSDANLETRQGIALSLEGKQPIAKESRKGKTAAV